MARDREKDELSSPELLGWEGNSELQDIIIQKVLARCQTLLDKEPVLFTNIYQDAWELVTRARRKAEELGLAVVITVVDPAAQVVMTYRMENALLVSNDMAYKKASGKPILDTKREEVIFEKVRSRVEDKRYQETIVATFSDILKRSREYQDQNIK